MLYEVITPPGHERPTVTQSDDRPADDREDKVHALVVKKVPDDNCIRCHNRSGRIGLRNNFV